MKLRHVLIALLTVPLLGAAPLNCAGVVAPGLAYPDPTGRWMGAELTLCDRLAAHLHRSSTRFTPILQSSDAPPPLDGDDVLFLPQQAVPKGFRAGPLLTDDYEAILVPASSRARSAADLAGRPICVEPGSPEEQALAAYFGAHHWTLQEFVFQEVDEMHDAYLAGRCEAIVSPVSLLVGLRGNADGGHQADRILPDHLGANPIVIAIPIDQPALAGALRE